MKGNLINKLPEVEKLELLPEEKHPRLPFDRTTHPILGNTPAPIETPTGEYNYNGIKTVGATVFDGNNALGTSYFFSTATNKWEPVEKK